MRKIRIENVGGRYEVKALDVDGEVMASSWWDEPDWAALSAMQLAELMGIGTPELGADVPEDALKQGDILKRALAWKT